MTLTKLLKKSLLLSSLLLALTACDLPTITPTEEPGTETPPATLSPSPSASPTATATAAPEITDTPTATPEYVYSERLENGDFEGPFDYWMQFGGFVGEAWYPVIWRDFEIPRVCQEGQTVGCNPPGLGTRNPEYKPAENWVDPLRVLSGNYAQQWFCASEHCFAGVAQNVELDAGETCTVSAWTQAWGDDGDGVSNVSGDWFRSDYATDDDKDNMHLLVVVNPDGDGIEFPFGENYFVRDFGFTDGIYDQPSGGAPVGLEFIATGSQATVAFIGYQIFPVGNANWYVDYASVWCYGTAPQPPTTPTPIGPMDTPVPVTPTPTQERVLDDHILLFGPDAYYLSAYPMVIRSAHTVNGSVMGGLDEGTPAPAVARWISDTGDRWACIDEGAYVTPNPDYETLNILICKEWVAMSVGGTAYGNVYEN